MRNKKRIILWISLLIVSMVSLIAVFCFFGKQEPLEVEGGSSASTSSDSHTAKDQNTNRFMLRQLSSDEKTVVVQLEIGGEVSLCRYSLSVQYDSEELSLRDYDADLGPYAPVVFPAKDDDGFIEQEFESGSINLTWANAENLKKDGEIILLTFDKTDSFSESATIHLSVNSVQAFKKKTVEDAEYNCQDLVVQ